MISVFFPGLMTPELQGSSILMPWADKVPSMVHAWYLGNATGEAIADVIFGQQNPGGKLSLTFPDAEEDVPSFGHFHSENGKVSSNFFDCRDLRDVFLGSLCGGFVCCKKSSPSPGRLCTYDFFQGYKHFQHRKIKPRFAFG